MGRIKNKLRFAVLNRDDFTCQYCGKLAQDIQLEVDHIISVKQGGQTRMNNLITACGECNKGKGAAQKVDSKRRNEMDIFIHSKLPTNIVPKIRLKNTVKQ